MNIQLAHTYEDIISLENLFGAWDEFIKGKRRKPDVQVFVRDLADHCTTLHEELQAGTYRHGPYQHFVVTDPKRRDIHKASVRDRVLHHAVHRILYPFFDRTFIADSYSCRTGKGLHKAVQRFCAVTHQLGRNDTRTCWVLKCDVRKFFGTIDHGILLDILSEYIPDQNILGLLAEIIGSFRTMPDRAVGLPLGNLTSQLFANVYLNQLDQWVKHTLKACVYIRYADDFLICSDDREWLIGVVPRLQDFLEEKLRLTLHPNKVSIKTIASGVDFLGWIQFPDHRVLRSVTKRRMIARMQEHSTHETFQSYLGLLKHGNAQKLQEQVKALEWLWSEP